MSNFGERHSERAHFHFEFLSSGAVSFYTQPISHVNTSPYLLFGYFVTLSEHISAHFAQLYGDVLVDFAAGDDAQHVDHS